MNTLVNKISQLAAGKRKLRLMEVCGTHTVAIFRSGIRQILPENVELVSGPGCPVCVTCDDYIDKAVAYARKKNFIVATFGDMLKVPGSRSSLATTQAEGADIQIVYSPLDCLKLAEEAGSSKAVNLVLLGRLSHYFNDIKPEAWQEAIEACVPPKFLELNKKAFELGKNS